MELRITYTDYNTGIIKILNVFARVKCAEYNNDNKHIYVAPYPEALKIHIR